MEASDYMLSFSNAWAVPGLMRIIHNAACGMFGVMRECNAGVPLLAEVARMLHKKHHRQRLLNTCYATALGKQFHSDLNSWKGLVYEPRWGTVANAVKSVLQRKRILQWGWDLEAFNRGTSGNARAIFAEDVDQALTCEFWWSKMMTLEHLCANVRMGFDWTSLCPCHSFSWDTDLKHVPPKIWKLWVQCPMSGRRTPEMAAGDFLVRFKQLCMVSTAKLVLDLPASLSSEQRATLLTEFERGRAYFVFILSLKTMPLRDVQTLLLELGHPNESNVRAALEYCLISDQNHPRIKELQTEPLMDEAVSYLAGEDIVNLLRLGEFLGAYRFGYSDEQRCEGLHAKVERLSGHSHNRTVAFDSLVLRLPFFRDMMRSADKGMLGGYDNATMSLADCLHTARNPRTVIARLGLSSHPSLKVTAAKGEDHHSWDRVFREVVYCSDDYTMFHQQPPEITLNYSVCGNDAGEAPVAVMQSSFFARLLRFFAAEMLHRRFTELSGDETMPVFALPVRNGCIRSLQDLVTHKHAARCDIPWLGTACDGRVQLSKATTGPWDAEQRGGHLFVSINVANPSDAKVIKKTGLSRTDLAINIHRVLKVAQPHVFVCTTPVNIEQSSFAEHFGAAVGLILSLGMFRLEDMLQVRRWDVRSTDFFFDRSCLSDDVLSTASLDVQARVWAMLLDEKSISKTIADDEQNAALGAVIASLHEQGLVELKSDEWHPAPVAREARVPAWCLRPPTHGEDAPDDLTNFVLDKAKPSDAIKDLSRYQLLSMLQDNGWSLQVSETQKPLRNIAKAYTHRDDPPNTAEEKRLFLICKGEVDNAKCPQAYLAAMASAHIHGRPVPHFAKVGEYLKLLDPDYKAPAKKRRKLSEHAQSIIEDCCFHTCKHQN